VGITRQTKPLKNEDNYSKSLSFKKRSTPFYIFILRAFCPLQELQLTD